jgi:hypothetical protein
MRLRWDEIDHRQKEDVTATREDMMAFSKVDAVHLKARMLR